MYLSSFLLTHRSYLLLNTKQYFMINPPPSLPPPHQSTLLAVSFSYPSRCTLTVDFTVMYLFRTVRWQCCRDHRWPSVRHGLLHCQVHSLTAATSWWDLCTAAGLHWSTVQWLLWIVLRLLPRNWWKWRQETKVSSLFSTSSFNVYSCLACHRLDIWYIYIYTYRS